MTPKRKVTTPRHREVGGREQLEKANWRAKDNEPDSVGCGSEPSWSW